MASIFFFNFDLAAFQGINGTYVKGVVNPEWKIIFFKVRISQKVSSLLVEMLRCKLQNISQAAWAEQTLAPWDGETLLCG